MQNRIYKFRAWDKENKKMLSPDELMTYPVSVKTDGTGMACLHHCSSMSDINYPNLIPLQFTGLLDKLGKEIYEGDIIKDKTLKHLKKIKNDEYGDCFVVEYGDIGCDYHGGIGYDMENECPSKNPNQYEVIGNIYENPELIK